jgi:DNA-binding PadR family transcriptional regulator
VTSRWEPADVAQTEGRPARRYYSLTTEGHARAVHALTETAQHRSRLTGLLSPEPGGKHA